MRFCFIALVLLVALAGHAEEKTLLLPDKALPLEKLPEQPKPLLAIGSGYLESENLGKGFTLPTGAVWQPQLMMWGSLRSALQGEFGDGREQAQWAN